MTTATRYPRLGRGVTATLVTLQLLFAACAMSVLLYNAMGWAPQMIEFAWGSYRALNIYGSLVLVAIIAVGLIRRRAWSVALVAAFALFHGLEGLVIGFWFKAILQLAALAVLAWGIGRGEPGQSTIARDG